ncbi:MAG: TIGR02996 domain-containing protein [Planctomycetes bacterium]|nr:TIGR02996 domain-containing protein [Planctomycetota bacterium]
MPTHDEAAFLHAIAAAPDDDTPRLVFADWLDERGSDDDRARAALIRAQCRIEVLPAGNKERKQLEREAKALLRAHERGWTAELRAAKLGTGWTFRRGFLDGGSMSPTKFVERGDELFRLAPTLRALRFPNAANEVTELAGSPFLARLASVDLTQMCTCGWCGIDEELRDLFKSKHAAGLRCLNVSLDRIDTAGARALARSKVLANLTDLDLSGNPLGAEGVGALVGTKNLNGLVSLDLSACSLGALGAAALAGAAHFPALRRLELRDNAITSAGIVALAGAAFFPALTDLDLRGNHISSEAGARAVAAHGANLERLDVRGCNLGARARAALKARFGSGLNA